jgi:hypothetical protein
LSDNEKTLTVDHIARIAVRHPTMVGVGRHYGITPASCVPADPQTKGGSEATVRISSADLVPTDANLLPSTPASASSDERVTSSVSGSMRDHTAPPAAHPTSGWRKSENACIHCQPHRSLPYSA